MKLLLNRLKQAEFTRTVWTIKPEPGTTLEEVLAPDYWAHVSKNLKPGDRVEVSPEDGEWFAELYVRSSSDNAVSVVVLTQYDFAPAKKAKPQVVSGNEYDIKHRGGAGWSVIRASDKAVVFEKGDTKAQAEEWVAINTLG